MGGQKPWQAPQVHTFLPARRYASVVFATATCLSVRPSVRLSVTAGIVRKRCILDAKLLWNGNRKPYASYRMVSLSMTLSDPWPGFQGHGSFKRRVSPKWCILQTQLLYRTLIGYHRQLSIDKLAIQLITPLLLDKPCKRFASIARVCQRQLAFLVSYSTVILMSAAVILSLCVLCYHVMSRPKTVVLKVGIFLVLWCLMW